MHLAETCFCYNRLTIVIMSLGQSLCSTVYMSGLPVPMLQFISYRTAVCAMILCAGLCLFVCVPFSCLSVCLEKENQLYMETRRLYSLCVSVTCLPFVCLAVSVNRKDPTPWRCVRTIYKCSSDMSGRLCSADRVSSPLSSSTS